jgi:hypothetical protein
MSLKYENDENKTITSDMVLHDISFNKSKEWFANLDNTIRFVKAVEKLVRKHPDYDVIVSTIREEYMDHCQILGNISREDAVLEIHHGPLFTLFDICLVVLNHLIANDDKNITTFNVAKIVLDEHRMGDVQFVVLSKTAHQLIDTGEIFINLNQGIGDIQSFITRYRDGIDEVMVDKINRYIDMSKKFESTDNGILELEDKMISWSYRNLSSDLAERI